MATSAVQDRWKAHFTNLAAWVATHLWVKTTCTALQREGGMPAFLVALKVPEDHVHKFLLQFAKYELHIRKPLYCFYIAKRLPFLRSTRRV